MPPETSGAGYIPTFLTLLYFFLRFFFFSIQCPVDFGNRDASMVAREITEAIENKTKAIRS